MVFDDESSDAHKEHIDERNMAREDMDSSSSRLPTIHSQMKWHSEPWSRSAD